MSSTLTCNKHASSSSKVYRSAKTNTLEHNVVVMFSQYLLVLNRRRYRLNYFEFQIVTFDFSIIDVNWCEEQQYGLLSALFLSPAVYLKRKKRKFVWSEFFSYSKQFFVFMLIRGYVHINLINPLDNLLTITVRRWWRRQQRRLEFEIIQYVSFVRRI